MTDEWADFQPASNIEPKAAHDQWADFQPAGQKDTTWRERLAAVSETAGGGAIEGMTAATGAAYGARLGASRGPVGLAVGTVVGAVTGGLAGGEARDLTPFRRPSEFPEELRPYAYAGELVGQAGPFAAMPYGPAMTGYRFPENVVGRWLNGVIETAKKKPIAFGLVEATAIGTSAVASGVAEKVAPGQELTRIGAEVISPLPTQAGLRLARTGFSKVGSIINTMSPAGRQTEAGKTLANMIAQVPEENPEMIMRVYREFQDLFPNLNPNDFTAAQITGSKSLAAIEVQLAKHSEKFGAEVLQRFNDSMGSVRMQIDLLTRTGDPAALKAAAELRTEYVRGLLEARFSMAEEVAQRAALNITNDTPAAREALSRKAYEAFDNVLVQVRKAENEMWEAVDRSREIGFDNLQGIISEHRRNLPPELQNSLPKKATDYLKRISASKQLPDSPLVDQFGRPMSDAVIGDPVGTTMGEAYQIRSAILDEARELSNAGKDNLARIYNDIGEAILDDIDKAFKGAGDDSYDAAREFTRQKHDVFTRSFVGEARAAGRFGDRIEPSLLMRKALAGGAEAIDLKFQELEEATRFMSTRGVDSEIDISTMLNAQERVIRLAAARHMNSLTGKINAKGLQDFIKNEDIIMKRFPEVKKDLQAAVTSEVRRAELEKLTKNRISYLESKTELGKIIKKDPTSIAQKALVSNSQEKDLSAFIAAGRKAAVGASNPQEVTEGVLSSIYSAAINNSMSNVTSGGQTSRVIDPGKFKNTLFSPKPPATRSPMDIMVAEGLLTIEESGGLKKLLEIGENLQRSRAPGTAVDIGGDVSDILIEGGSRMAGTFLAKGAAKAFDVKNIPITAYGVSANLGQQFMLKLPQKSARGFLMQAMLNHGAEMTNPITGAKTTLLDMLMTSTSNIQESALMMRQVNSWFIRQGIFNFPDEGGEENIQWNQPLEETSTLQ